MEIVKDLLFILYIFVEIYEMICITYSYIKYLCIILLKIFLQPKLSILVFVN